MTFDKIAWIFDSRIEPPVNGGVLFALIFRWTVITAIVCVLGAVCMFIAGLCVGFDVGRMMAIFPYVRAAGILVLCGFMVYATYRNAAYRNRQKLDEDEAMYKEIAAYYREKKKGV